MTLDIRPLTPSRWPDLEAVFAARGCSAARGCWCMYYRVSGKGPLTRPGDGARAARRRWRRSPTTIRRPDCSASAAMFRWAGYRWGRGETMPSWPDPR